MTSTSKTSSPASYHDLNQSDYAFTHQGWTQEGPRFALHFSLSTVGVEEPNAADLFVAYQNQDRIMLRSIGEGFSAYRLYGLNGQELSSGPLTRACRVLRRPPARDSTSLRPMGLRDPCARNSSLYTSLSYEKYYCINNAARVARSARARQRERL